jgi:hypothetical protein
MTSPTRFIFAVGVTAALIAAPAFAAETASNPNGCKVVERAPGSSDNSGSLSSSVTAGNGRVSAQSTGPNSVTVNSGNGSTSSSVSTTGSGGHSTTVTTSDGNCTIYVNPGEKKDH